MRGPKPSLAAQPVYTKYTARVRRVVFYGIVSISASYVRTSQNVELGVEPGMLLPVLRNVD